MSSCTNWVTQQVITCKNWSTKIDKQCTTWADEGSNQCSAWADKGSNQCSAWADKGSSQCTSWEECHWYTPWNCIAGFFCRAYYWVANWVCQAYYWLANWVCQAYYWLAKWVCKAFAWIVSTICVVFGWLSRLVCVAWDTLRCAWLGLFRRKRRDGAAAQKIEHVFVLMLENRSFDHMFGFSNLAGVDSDGAPTVVRGPDVTQDANFDPFAKATVPVMMTPNADFSLSGIDEDPGHEFEDTLMSLCAKFKQEDGTLIKPVYNPVLGGYPEITGNGYIENYGLPSAPDGKKANTPPRIMRCFDTKNQLPVLYQLASEYALCDNWFSSLPGPTWPNRFFLLGASSGGLDGSPGKLDIVSSTTVEGYRFANGNIFDLLDANCIDWKIYEGDEFPVSFALSGMNLNALQGRFKDFEDFSGELNESSFDPKFVFIEPKYGSHSFDVTGPGDFTCGNSMHPLDDVTRGEKLVKTVYEAIRNSPQWEKSMLIIVFDEHGGFYDHVKPPAAVPPGDTITESYQQNGFKFDQLGVRVPALVISPFIQKGVIDHTLYDHTSMLATVERLFGMKNLTERDKAANDLLHLLSLDAPRTDTLSTLNNPATNPQPLPCDEEDDPSAQDALLIKRSELRMAQRTEKYKGRPTRERPPTSTQVGFTQVALLKVLQTAEYPAREKWIAQYKAIESGVDAALFVTEAQLKLRHGIDFKTLKQPDDPGARQRMPPPTAARPTADER